MSKEQVKRMFQKTSAIAASIINFLKKGTNKFVPDAIAQEDTASAAPIDDTEIKVLEGYDGKIIDEEYSTIQGVASRVIKQVEQEQATKEKRLEEKRKALETEKEALFSKYKKRFEAIKEEQEAIINSKHDISTKSQSNSI